MSNVKQIPQDGELLPVVGGPIDGALVACEWLFPWVPSPNGGFTRDGHWYELDGMRWVHKGRRERGETK